jgi:hypothetical protein
MHSWQRSLEEHIYYECAEGAGANFTKEATRAQTWANGVDISYDLGIGLRTTTGYGTAASVHFHCDTRGRLCGTADFPGNTPKNLVGKAPA